MNLGALTHILIITRQASGKTAAGAPSGEWTEIARTYAELVEQSTTVEKADRGSAIVTALTFKARFVDGLTPEDRVIVDGKVFAIVGIAELERRHVLEIRMRRTGT